MRTLFWKSAIVAAIAFLPLSWISLGMLYLQGLFNVAAKFVLLPLIAFDRLPNAALDEGLGEWGIWLMFVVGQFLWHWLWIGALLFGWERLIGRRGRQGGA